MLIILLYVFYTFRIMLSYFLVPEPMNILPIFILFWVLLGFWGFIFVLAAVTLMWSVLASEFQVTVMRENTNFFAHYRSVKKIEENSSSPSPSSRSVLGCIVD